MTILVSPAATEMNLPKFKLPTLIPKATKELICGGKKCKTCIKSVCKECYPGYGTSPDNGCFSCEVKNCVQCNSNKNYCNECKNYYFFNPMSNLCKKCSMGCRVCHNELICLECGFFFQFRVDKYGKKLRECKVSWKSLLLTLVMTLSPVLLFFWCMWYKFFSKYTRESRRKSFEKRLEK